MTQDERDEREEALVKVLSSYLMAFPQSKMDSGAMAIYARALSDFTPRQIDAAMTKLLRVNRFFPAVAEIIEAVESVGDFAAGRTIPTPAEAWGEVMEQAKTNFVYKPWEYSCPEVEAAVRAFGKDELCSLEIDAVNTARAQFMRMYQQIVDRRKDNKANAAAAEIMGPVVERLSAGMAITAALGGKREVRA